MTVKYQLSARQEAFFETHRLGTLLMRPVERIVRPYAWIGHIPFARALVRMMRPEVFVELGTHTGNSFCAFCQAVVEEGSDTRCYAIDTWEGDDQAGYYSDAVFNDLAPYVNDAYGAFAKLLRITFDQALDQFENGSIDLLHIDGLHTYEAVRHDYETWKEKLSSRGVILFHDTQVRDRGFGVFRLWEELRQIYPGFEFFHSHGLGVLLVGDEIPSAVVEFIALAVEEPEPIQALFEQASLLWLSDDAADYQRRFGTKASANTAYLDCELYLDLGKGFNENEKMISSLPLEHGKGIVRFDLERFSSDLSGLRFDPCSGAIALGSFSARACDKNGVWQMLQISRSSALTQKPEELLFAADPWVEFDHAIDNIVSVEIELEVKAVGNALIPLLGERAKQVSALEAELAAYKLESQKLWNDIAELQAELAAYKLESQKLWNDIAEKDRMYNGLKALMQDKR